MNDSVETAPAIEQRQAARAYEGIRRRILSGGFRPGEHLREAHLAELTGASRTPVRDALRLLTGEGLVMIGENHRSYVVEFDPVQADIVFEIRVRLESLAASLAATRIDARGIADLESIATRIEALGQDVSDATLLEFMELNLAFHQRIVEATGSEQLAAASRRSISVPLVLLKHHVWAKTVNIVQSNDQHREIIRALRSRNAHWAEACMAAHINSTRPPTPAVVTPA
jgi:DNA-binding GntR family transcriptional regulator